jgi:hypothetical protein
LYQKSQFWYTYVFRIALELKFLANWMAIRSFYEWKFSVFYGILVYINILWSFGMYVLPCFGKLYQEKSGIAAAQCS